MVCGAPLEDGFVFYTLLNIFWYCVGQYEENEKDFYAE